MNNLPSDQLQNLLNRIVNRDEQAVMTLYRHYQHFLFAFVQQRLRDDAVAEEVVQDCFMAICDKPLAYNGTTAFSTWLCSIARNKVADRFRRQGRQVPTDSVDDEVLTEIPGTTQPIVDQLEEEQNSTALRLCIEALPAGMRETIMSVYIEEQTIEDVAEQLDVPSGTVKSRLFNARQRLQQCMERWMKGAV